MAVDTPRQRSGPTALSALFDSALQQLTTASKADAKAPASDAFLYSGNRHESVPRALFLDRRLTPLERNAWQVFRLLLNHDGLTAFPTYDQLRPWLASMPCNAQASYETVARALTLLRLTRWLSLVRKRRDPKGGRIVGNIYVLHDEPLTPFEAMQLDPDYLGLVSNALGHAAKAVQVVGIQTLKEIAEDPLLTGRTLPSRLQVLTQRMAQAGWPSQAHSRLDPSHESEEGKSVRLRNDDPQLSESEAGLEPASAGLLRNPKKDRTVRKKNIKEVRTTVKAHVLNELRLPEGFVQLKQEQQTGVAVALQQVEHSLRQAVLDEWEARCAADSIRNPAGYLFGIIQRAIRGEFNAWAGRSQASMPECNLAVPVPDPRPVPRTPTPSEVAHQHIERLKALIHKS